MALISTQDLHLLFLVMVNKIDEFSGLDMLWCSREIPQMNQFSDHGCRPMYHHLA